MIVSWKTDVARQGAIVAGALFQVIVTARAVTGITAVTGAGEPPLIEPAAYAFAIWPVIFALSLAYAAYQALPAQRANPLLRDIGWWTALAFLCTSLWSIFVPRSELAAAQAMLLTMGVALGVAYVRIAAEGRRRPLTGGERWFVAMAIGPFFGWMTAANPVSLFSFLGSADGPSSGLAVLGAALLLATGGFAAAMVRIGRGGPAHLFGSYAATIVWAVAGIAINQFATSPLITAAALLAAAPVIAALALPTRPAPPRRAPWGRVRPGAA